MATVSFNSGTQHVFGSHMAVATAGVTPLDTPQSSQTKTEIRTLVAEIADLSGSPLELSDYLNSVLPRICIAMGATSAATWTVSCDGSPSLLAAHNLPAVLTHPASSPSKPQSLESSSEASTQTGSIDFSICESSTTTSAGERVLPVAAHARVLACAALEGVPVSVPPNSVRLQSDRPTNPLPEALFIAPMRIEQRVDVLLEVILPPSGGPAAQRGYLRFVAQMADLISDFLRRQRLRQLSLDAKRVGQLQQLIMQTGAARTSPERWHVAARAIARWLDADMVLLLSPQGRRWRVRGCSELASFDPRSEIVTAAERVLVESPTTESTRAQAADILAGASSEHQPPWQAEETASQSLRQHSARAESLRRALDTSHLVRLPLIDGRCVALLACDQPLDLKNFSAQAEQLVPTLATQLSCDLTDANKFPWAGRLRDWSPATFRSPTTPAHGPLRRWAFACACVALVLAVAFFPTPDQISVVAVLEATDKQMYYAPANGMIERVLVDSDTPVKAGQVLLQLVDKPLEARLDELKGKRASTANQLEQDRGALVRGTQLNARERDDLESRIEQLKIQLMALDDQLGVLRLQANELSIVARCDAAVTTWDVRNRLEGRPVTAGQLLLATCAPQTPWQLQLSIPERKAGLVQAAMRRAGGGIPVQFSLSSHPDELRRGTLIGLSKQLLKDELGNTRVLGTVQLDGQQLPTQTDGAVARAAIDCGTVPAVWLVLRDAYREASAWVRMFW